MKDYDSYKWKLLLSSKKIGIAIIALAVIVRLIHTTYFFNIGTDRSFQFLAAYNLLEGHGISLAHINPGDLSNPVYQPLINWPPGYSVLLVLFYILFGNNYLAAGFAICIIAVIAFIIISRRILTLLGVPIFIVNSYTLLNAFLISYFSFLDNTDGIAITFFLIAFNYILLLHQTKKNWLKNSFYIAACLFFCTTLKYLFIPVAFIPPIFLLIQGIINENAIFKKAGLLCLTILIISVGLLLLYQKHLSGSFGYISEPVRGFYPEHLLRFYPMVPASFISLNTLQKIVGFQSTNYSGYLRFFQCIHLIIFISLFIVFIKDFGKRSLRNLNTTIAFFYISFLIWLTITALLSALSLTVEAEKVISGGIWTYVQDARYFGLVIVLLHLSIFVFYRFTQQGIKFRKYLFYLLLLLMLPEVFRGMAFTANRAAAFKKEEYFWQYEYDLSKYAGTIIEKEKKINTDKRIVLTGSSWLLNNRVSLYNHVPILEATPTIKLSA